MSIVDKIIQIADTISSPQQMIGQALNLLASKDKSTAAMLAQMIKNGDDPAKALERFSREGKINKDNLGTIKHLYSLAKKGGLKGFDVPESVWEQADKALSSGDTTGSWF